LSELSDKPVSNPAEVLRLGEKVKAKIILLDPKNRKIGLSIKQVKEEEQKKKGRRGRPKKATKTT
jgi:small subunit ribosomal protein S1